ncbi:hypothetical protein GTA08_BOTSDO02543 [Neofusicoccum parvum]|uniref:Uncharacterized protein n=1 Tax=Neofusicoccum parvum TaxID=310453 RepID=A0ACB5RP56_9PEZI|nr:hypothetical protein GTA08_BOTSDO02543 [Neofusicoccum parvum]
MSSNTSNLPNYSKANEASKEDSLYGRQSFDTVSTLPQYTEKSDSGNAQITDQSSSAKSKSKFSSAFDQVKAKVGGKPDSPERAAERAAEKERREEEYKKLKLGEKTKYGWGGGGMSWSG